MRMRQMLAMQQQQAQQVQQSSAAGQQATPQLVAQLQQRNLNQGMQHQYQHQPPPY